MGKKDQPKPHNRYDGTAFSLGCSWQTGKWEVGAAISIEHGDRNYRMDWSPATSYDRYFRVDNSTNVYGLTLFGSYANEEWNGKASLFAAYQHASNYKSRNFKRRAESGYFAADIEVGKTYSFSNRFYLQPHLGLTLTQVTSEHSRVQDIAITDKPKTKLEIPIGLTMDSRFVRGNFAIRPFVDITAVIIAGRDFPGFRPGVSSFNGDEWRVYGIGGNGIGGRIKTGLEVARCQNLSVGLNYQYERRQQFHDHRIAANLKIAF